MKTKHPSIPTILHTILNQRPTNCTLGKENVKNTAITAQPYHLSHPSPNRKQIRSFSKGILFHCHAPTHTLHHTRCKNIIYIASYFPFVGDGGALTTSRNTVLFDH
jgi:hypothetical protein